MLVIIIIMVVVANIAIDPVVLTLVTSVVGALALKGSVSRAGSFGVTQLLYSRIFPNGNILMF
jgi:hypothetical protein